MPNPFSISSLTVSFILAYPSSITTSSMPNHLLKASCSIIFSTISHADILLSSAISYLVLIRGKIDSFLSPSFLAIHSGGIGLRHKALEALRVLLAHYAHRVHRPIGAILLDS